MNKALFDGKFGIEKEGLRLNLDGSLAKSPHPFKDDPEVYKDFCESQTEIITPVADSIDEVYSLLKKITDRVNRVIGRQGEFLWNFSNPPKDIDWSHIPVAEFEGDDLIKKEYRKYLLKKYGKKKMLYSGIHFNYSVSDEYLRSIDISADELYLDLAVKVLSHAWLIVFLTAASPREGYASPRCSEIGYWNDFLPVLDYISLQGYVKSIEDYINDGRLFSAWELYLPVRLKPRGANTLDQLKKGINHIELRMLDVNPLDTAGFAKADLEFLHLLLIYLISKPKAIGCMSVQKDAIDNMKKAALLDISSVTIRSEGKDIPIEEAALDVLADMAMFFEPMCDGKIMRSIADQRDKILSKDGRYAVRVEKYIEEKEYVRTVRDKLNGKNKYTKVS